MSQEISSLMDGELDPAQAERTIRSCCQDPDAREKWYLYHVIGETLRGHPPSALSAPTGLRDKLAAEPAIVARPRRTRETPFARIALAAAASVATVGVVGWIGTQGGQAPASATPVAKGSPAIQPVVNTAPPAAVVRQAPTVDVHDYYIAHKQLPYRPVVNRSAPAAQAR